MEKKTLTSFILLTPKHHDKYIYGSQDESGALQGVRRNDGTSLHNTTSKSIILFIQKIFERIIRVTKSKKNVFVVVPNIMKTWPKSFIH